MSEKSSKYYLVKVDIGGKQKYIFSTNILKEIIGASEIIKFITEELGKRILNYMNNLKLKGGKFSTSFFDSNGGNILIEAGGNSIYIFKDKEHAKIFNNIFSRFVMTYCDSLELIMAIQEFDIEKSSDNSKIISVKEALDEIENKLSKKQGERKNLFRRISYGLTTMCSRTKKPKGYKLPNNEDLKYISKESYDKQRFYNNISNYESEEYDLIYKEYKESFRLQESKYLKKVEDFVYTTELDKLAGSDDKKSYIGITCIDGNGMGEKINNFYNSFKFNENKNMKENNLIWLKKYRQLTEEIKVKYENAYNYMIRTLIDKYNNYKKEIFGDSSERIIPIRPIILAGDDITFISNGKIAIEATKLFTENITNSNVNFDGEKEKLLNLTISAGIAIVRKKYPFSRAVKLAGELEKSSKRKLKRIKNIDKEVDASFIDWYVDRGNMIQGLNEIRNEQNLELTARPYMIPIDNREEKLKIIGSLQELSKKKETFPYKFDHFYKVLNTIKALNKNSNLKGFYRTMNTNETNANLFSLKYLIENDFQKNELSEGKVRQVIYDVIEIQDLYECIDKNRKDMN